MRTATRVRDVIDRFRGLSMIQKRMAMTAMRKEYQESERKNRESRRLVKEVFDNLPQIPKETT
jgi:hypothetical protein